MVAVGDTNSSDMAVPDRGDCWQARSPNGCISGNFKGSDTQVVPARSTAGGPANDPRTGAHQRLCCCGGLALLFPAFMCYLLSIMHAHRAFEAQQHFLGGLLQPNAMWLISVE